MNSTILNTFFAKNLVSSVGHPRMCSTIFFLGKIEKERERERESTNPLRLWPPSYTLFCGFICFFLFVPTALTHTKRHVVRCKESPKWC